MKWKLKLNEMWLDYFIERMRVEVGVEWGLESGNWNWNWNWMRLKIWNEKTWWTPSLAYEWNWNPKEEWKDQNHDLRPKHQRRGPGLEWQNLEMRGWNYFIERMEIEIEIEWDVGLGVGNWNWNWMRRWLRRWKLKLKLNETLA